MSEFVVVLKEPKPAWFRFRARKEWNTKRETMQAIIDTLPKANAERVQKALRELMFYGEATL